MPSKTPANKPVLTAAFAALALHIQEAATTLSHSDISRRLDNALSDATRGTGSWCYLLDVFGDDQSGDVIYSCSGELKRAPYTCSTNGASIDLAKAVDVVPVTTYEPEGADLNEAGRRNSSRDLKQLQSIHDGAVNLGAACATKESKVPVPVAANSAVKLVECAATLEPIVLREARSDYEIKLIAPGKGSSAFYPKEVLQRDGPKVFKASTHVYLNHPTAAEEAARPEGDVANLAGVLTTDAVYHELHAKGEGLYARMKVFADHATTVEEKAPHVGMSIRAGGVAESGKMRDGLPILKELTHAESVDVVTRAGAGGLILTEAAVPPNPTQGGAPDMDAAEFKKLQESVAAQTAANAKLLERALRGDAREEAAKILKGVTLIDTAKERVIESILRGTIPQTPEGALDTIKFTEAVNTEAKAEGAYVAALVGSGRVIGMGAGSAPAPAPIDPKEAERVAAEKKTYRESAVKAYMDMGLPKAAAEAAADRPEEEAA